MADNSKKYLALIPKDETSNLVIHGCCHPYFPIIEISATVGKEDVDKLLSLANPFDYAFEKFLVALSTSNPLIKGKNVATSSLIYATEITDVYALTEEARRIGLPGIDIEIKPPVCESSFIAYLTEQQVNEAYLGAREILKMKKVDFREGKNEPILRKGAHGFVSSKDVRNSLLNGGDALNHSKNESIWTYLLTYTRHQPYPNDLRGYALDAIHVAFSHAQGCEIDASMTKSNLWREHLSEQNANLFTCPESETLRQLASIIEKDKGFQTKVGKQGKDFFLIAMTFLAIKEELQQGTEHLKSTYGSLDQMLCSFEDRLMPDSVDTFNKVLYLIGLTLGYRGVTEFR